MSEARIKLVKCFSIRYIIFKKQNFSHNDLLNNSLVVNTVGVMNSENIRPA